MPTNPQPTETPTPEQPAEQQTAAPDPAQEALARELEQARIQAYNAQLFAQQQQEEAQRLRAEAMIRRGAPEPMADLSEVTEKLITDPKGAASNLREFVMNEAGKIAEQKAAQIAQQAAQQMFYEQQKQRTQAAIEQAMAGIPELSDPKNRPKFDGAAAMAMGEFRERGMQATPEMVMRRATELYRSQFSGQRSQQPPAFVEGGSRPDLGGNPGQKPLEKNELEKRYKLQAGTVVEADEKALTREYVKRTNEERLKHGITPTLLGALMQVGLDNE